MFSIKKKITVEKLPRGLELQIYMSIEYKSKNV